MGDHEEHEEQKKIDELNTQLDKLKQGFVTTLSESEDLPPYDNDEYMTLETKQLLQLYLIKDIVGIIEQYLEWRLLDHIPLFSVPLRKIRKRLTFNKHWFYVRNLVLFGRTDRKEFTLHMAVGVYYSALVSGHFPLLIHDNFFDIDIFVLDPDTQFLVGYIGSRFKNTNLYPKIDNFLFTWSKEHARIIGFRDESGIFRPHSLWEQSRNYSLFYVQSGSIKCF